MTNYGIRIRHEAAGADHIFIVTGGVEHVGAVAIATHTSDSDSKSPQLLQLEGHREGELAIYLAELASFMLGSNVTVAAGIHIDHATKAQIIEIVEETKALMLHWLLDYLEKH